MLEELAGHMSQAIGEQAQTYMAKVSVVQAKRGYILAYSERWGNIKVLSRTNDKLSVGDMIYVRRAGPEKHAPFLYAGFGHGAGGQQTPGISSDAPIYIEPGTNSPAASAPAGTLQAILNELAEQIRRAKGTTGWKDTVSQSLSGVINWRKPVDLITQLPTVGARSGDIVLVRENKTLYAFISGGWQALNTGGSGGSGSGGSSVVIPNGYTNMAVGCPYTLSPAPHSNYPDHITRRSPGTGFAVSGGLLTDGDLGGINELDQSVGWYQQSEIYITLDLGRARSGNLLRLWGLALDGDAIYRPSAAVFSYSDDGMGWTDVQTRIGLQTDGSVTYERWLLEADIKDYGLRRFWRIKLNGSAGYILVSEMEFMAGIDDEVDTVQVADNARTTLTVGAQGITVNKIVANLPGGLVTAHVGTQGHAGYVLGISTDSKAAGEALTLQTSGVYVFGTNVFSTLGPAFLGANGTIVTQVPAGAKFVQPLGIIISSNKLMLAIESPLLV